MKINNEKIAMDLKQWNSRWILHIKVMWSRHNLPVFNDRKKPSNNRCQWTGKVDAMRTLMKDNGGDFYSEEMRNHVFSKCSTMHDIRRKSISKWVV